MISNENTILTDLTSNESILYKDIDNLKNHLMTKVKSYLIMKNVITALLCVSSITIMFLIYSKILRYLPVNNTAGIFIGCILFLLLLIFLIRLGMNKLFRKYIKHFSKKNGDIIEESIKVQTVKFLYRDLLSGKMQIQKIGTDYLYVSCLYDDEVKSFNIPLRCNIYQSENNRIEFFDNYLDVYLTEERERDVL